MLTVNVLLNRIAAMELVWQYGEKSGFESWKGLAWGIERLTGLLACYLPLSYQFFLKC
jgi:hypothetical protein